MTLSADAVNDPAAATLAVGDLEARFLPTFGMLGASLRHRGTEVLRRIDDLQSAAAKGSTAGIPFLYPWANRLAGLRYAAAGKSVVLDPNSPFLHYDANGLPIHGVPWSRLSWTVIETGPDSVTAGLDWSRPECLAVFPFRHRLTMTASLMPDSLTVETTLDAESDGPVPVSFGFHPYLAVPDLPRADWRLRLPAMRHLLLDQRGLPTGREQSFDGLDAALGARDFDDGFALLEERAALSIAGAGRCIAVELLEGYRCAQVFAPKEADYIALEPMTAPTNALVSGEGLQSVGSGGRFRALFRIRLSADT